MNTQALVVLAALTAMAAAGAREVVTQAQEKPAATATDWPQWRGPRRDGSIDAALPAQWPAALKKRWETPVGGGHASPVVSGNRVVVIARESDQEIVRALDLSSGKEIWRAAYPAPYSVNPAAQSHGPGPKSTPAIAGGRVFTFGVGGVLSAESWPLLDYRNGAWLGGRVRASEKLATLVKPDTRVVPTDGRMMTGADVVSQRDMYQKLFSTMIGYLNKGMGPEDAVEKNPVKEYQAEFGDPSAFLYGALRSMMIAYVPD
jgi:hypothetical protein